MHKILGDQREVAITRELTKPYEEIRKATLGELVSYYAQHTDIRGEIVLLISPINTEKQLDDNTLDLHIKNALQTMRLKEAVAFVAEHTHIPKKIIYTRALFLQQKK
jgi:16S rRNA (cytidine1402-2'-O)-methyltransferase